MFLLRVIAALLTAAALAACSAAEPPAPTPPVGAPATTVPPRTAPATSAPKAFPPNVTAFDHRGTYWFVVVALARTEDDPTLAAAERSLGDIGYLGVDTLQVSECDEGLAEGLQLKDGDYFHVSPAFPDAATAQRFVDAYRPGVVGTVQVVTGCLD